MLALRRRRGRCAARVRSDTSPRRRCGVLLRLRAGPRYTPGFALLLPSAGLEPFPGRPADASFPIGAVARRCSADTACIAASRRNPDPRPRSAFARLQPSIGPGRADLRGGTLMAKGQIGVAARRGRLQRSASRSRRPRRRSSWVASRLSPGGRRGRSLLALDPDGRPRLGTRARTRIDRSPARAQYDVLRPESAQPHGIAILKEQLARRLPLPDRRDRIEFAGVRPTGPTPA